MDERKRWSGVLHHLAPYSTTNESFRQCVDFRFYLKVADLQQPQQGVGVGPVGGEEASLQGRGSSRRRQQISSSASWRRWSRCSGGLNLVVRLSSSQSRCGSFQ